MMSDLRASGFYYGDGPVPGLRVFLMAPPGDLIAPGRAASSPNTRHRGIGRRELEQRQHIRDRKGEVGILAFPNSVGSDADDLASPVQYGPTAAARRNRCCDL